MPEWLVVLIVAVLGTAAGLVGARYGRIGHLERKLDAAVHGERVLWLYTRTLIDHIYRETGPPPPPPPPGYLDRKDTE